MSGGNSLREVLGVASDPDFELDLLPGWERRSPKPEDEDALDRALRARFMQLQRPDLYAAAKRMLSESYESMRSKDVIAYYAATGGSGDTALIPGSIMVTVKKSSSEESLDGYVSRLIQQEHAAPLMGDKRILRVERERITELEGTSVATTGLQYLTPIPGSRRRRALQLVASFARPTDVPGDDPKIVAYKTAFDVCVSSLRWVPAS